jgi:hypothetical protein
MADQILTIYGASDDLIEVEGTIDEEFNPRDVDSLIAVSDGTLLRIRYVDGVWRITPVTRGAADLRIEQAPEDDDRNYSDRATLTGINLRWVALGSAYAVRGG